MDYARAWGMIDDEAQHARKNHTPFASMFEAMSVIETQMAHLRFRVYRGASSDDIARELKQLGAACLNAMTEVC